MDFELEEQISRWMVIEAQGQAHCLAFVCAFLARALNFDLRALILALEVEATRLRQAGDKGYALGPLDSLASSLRAAQGPAPVA
jgi:hypothetical protein